VDPLQISRSQFKVSDFLGWQREGSLSLSPSFQRRAVWKADAKSFLVDTVVRGLPTPVIFIRERVDLETQRTVREVVDGQQRLRTLIGFIDDRALPDFDPARDQFDVKRNHNKAIAGKRFMQLEEEYRSRILGYEFSTHTLPSSMDDRAVLQMFARLNSTGVKLNGQELRNAEYFGVFKGLMYELGYEQLERWRGWRLFSEDDIARMREVEVVSDLAKNMIDGLSGKTQRGLDDLYARYDDRFDGATVLARRFRFIMDQIEEILGDDLPRTVYRSEVYFVTLFSFFYDLAWGLGSPLKQTRARPIASTPIRACLKKASARFQSQKVPAEVLDAVLRASADIGRRRTRLTYLKLLCK
jgi:hypothetical protein